MFGNIINHILLLLFSMMLVCLSQVCYASSQTDSLRLKYQQADSQEERLMLQLDLSEAYLKINIDSALILGLEAHEQAQAISFDKGIYEGAIVLGKIYQEKKVYNKSVSFYETTLAYYQEQGNHTGIVSTYSLLGKVYSLQRQYEKSIMYYDESIKASALYNLKVLGASAHFDKGLVLMILNDYDAVFENILIAKEMYIGTDRYAELVKCYNYLGILAAFKKDEYEIGRSYFNKVLELEASKNMKLSTNILYINLGYTYLRQGAYEKAIEAYVNAWELSKEKNDIEGVLYAIATISDCHFQSGNYEKSEEYALKGLQYAQTEENDYYLAINNLRLGEVYKATKKYDAAIDYLKRAYNYLINDKNLRAVRNLVIVYINMGDTYLLKKEYSAAESTLFKALDLNQEREDTYRLVEINTLFTRLFLETNQLEKALIYAEKAYEIADKYNMWKKKLVIADLLTIIYKKKNSFPEALFYAEVARITNDSIFNIEKHENYNLYALEFDNELKELKLKEQQLLIVNNANQKKQLILRSILGLMFLMGVGQWYFFKLKRKSEKAETELLIKEKETVHLKKIDKLKTSFFQSISHEFRTPLTLIIGPLNDIVSGSLKGDFHEKNKMMLRNAEKLLHLINQLLDLSKLEANKMQLEAQEVEFIQWISTIYHSFDSLAVRKKIKYELILPKEPIICWMDMDKMETVFINLLYNAFKFTNPNDAIHVIANTTAENKLVVQIKDTGIGISPVDQKHIFNKFYQADRTNKKTEQGTGIGLTLVKELVELNKGTVSISSVLNKETIFTICLPLGMEHLKKEEIFIIDAKPIPAANNSHLIKHSLEELDTGIIPSEALEFQLTVNDKILLIVEDNKDLRMYIEGVLKDDYKIITAINGRDGYEKAIKIVPDLIISDIMMPIMDGKEMVKLLKKDISTSHIPVIMLTALSGMKDKLEGLELGVESYLYKPFSREELKLIIRNIVVRHSLLKEKYSLSINRTIHDTKFGEITHKERNLPSSAPTIVKSENQFLRQVLTAIESNLGDGNFGVTELSKAVFLSRYQVHRKIKALTGHSTSTFIRKIRLNHAKKLLENKEGNITEIAFRLGFNSIAYFSKSFADEFGHAPSKTFDIKK